MVFFSLLNNLCVILTDLLMLIWKGVIDVIDVIDVIYGVDTRDGSEAVRLYAQFLDCSTQKCL